jgi:hypothetical protein
VGSPEGATTAGHCAGVHLRGTGGLRFASPAYSGLRERLSCSRVRLACVGPTQIQVDDVIATRRINACVPLTGCQRPGRVQSKLTSVCNSCPCIRLRPLRKPSSITTLQAATRPPSASIKRTDAAMVPPVASRSSMMATRSPV